MCFLTLSVRDDLQIGDKHFERFSAHLKCFVARSDSNADNFPITTFWCH